MNTKRNIFLWTLYDFANSIVFIVFFLYFAQWIVIDMGVSDIRFNLAFTLSALLLLLTVPLTGVFLDKHWRRITGIRYATIGTAFFYSACALASVFGYATMALIFFTAALFVYLLSFTFYTPLLHDIAPEELRGRVSGFGIAANYLGQFAGLALALPFPTGVWSIFGASPRAETLLPSVIVFFLFALPMLIWFKEPHKEEMPVSLRTEAKTLFSKTRELFAYRGVGLFMFSYFFFNDAVLTAANNFPIFLEQVWHISDATKTYLLIGILVTSALGGIISGFIADRYGHKKTLMIILAGWIVILPAVGFVSVWGLFVAITVSMGTWFGANWTVSRAMMADLAPRGKHNLAFAYFGLVERASSFVGPIVWGLVVSNFTELGSDRYRYAILAVTCFVVFGILALRKVSTVHKEKPFDILAA